MIEIVNNQSTFNVDEKMTNLIENACKSVLDILGYTSCKVSILITDNEGIWEINRNFRNIDAPTDVLSFPNILDFSEIGSELPFIGDIALSVDRAIGQAEEYNHSIEREFAFLVVHGMLHLLGYDHIEKEDEIVMIEKQKEVLEHMNLGR